MKYTTEEIKSLLISSIPKRLKKDRIQKDFIKSLILNAVLAVGIILGAILCAIGKQWAIFAILLVALAGIALLFVQAFKSKSVLLKLEEKYYNNIDIEAYEIATDSIVQKTFNPNACDEDRYCITLASGITKNLYKYFYELCEIDDIIYTIQVTDFPVATGFVLPKNDREFPLN